MLLKDFRRWIVQEEINENKKLTQKSKSKVVSFNKFSQKGSRIEWIEKLLQTPIDDYRNYCMWAILVPYLLNVKHLSEENTFKILGYWLHECNKLKKLSFDPRSKIHSAIRGNKGYMPISYPRLKEESKALYLMLEKGNIFLNGNS